MASLYQRNGIWWISFYDKGKHVRKSLQTRDLAAAKLIQAEVDRQLALRSHGLRSYNCPPDVFAEKYFPDAESHKRPATVSMDRIVWLQFMEAIAPTDLANVTPLDIEDFKTSLINRGLAPKSVNDYIGHLASMFSWATERELLRDNPASKVRKLKLDKKKPRWLSKEEAAKVMEIAESKGRNIYLVFALGLFAGMRKNEIINAKWEWFDFQRKVVTLKSDETFKLKGGEDRTLPLSTQLAEILEPYREKEGYVFPKERSGDSSGRYRYDPKKAVISVYKEAGILPTKPYHTLRHTFASLLVMEGVSLYKVSQWLGHKDIRTTQIYAHLAQADAEIDKLQIL